MRITFDLRRVGLGDNGGSSTLINSANTLVNLGHDVVVVDSMRNQHTWTKLEAKHIVANHTRSIPDADFIMATGYKSVGLTVKSPPRCGKKLHWIRGWETWQMSEGDIVKRVLGAPTIKLVNGIGLQNKLKMYNCKSYIVRPGYDIKNYKPLGYREKNKKIILGGLYNAGRNRNIKRTSWLDHTVFNLKSHRDDIQFWLFGTHPPPKGFWFDNYVRKPSLEEKNIFYNHINIWLAPTTLEGLHMPPAEAMLTGCPVVGTNAKMSGMHEYLIDGVTGIVAKNDLNDFIERVDDFIDDKELQIKLGNNAREKVLNLGDRTKNMKKFISLLEKLNENI